MNNLKDIIKIFLEQLWEMIPFDIAELFKPVLNKIINTETLERLLLIKFSKHLMSNREKTIKRIISNKKYMPITKLMWAGTYFNIAILNNIMSLIVYSLYKGCIPIVKINDSMDDKFQWEWYFKQLGELFEINDFNTFEEIPCDKVLSPFRPTWEVYDMELEEFKIWQFMFQNFIQLNVKTEKYIENQKLELGNVNSMLGVLIRGIDYITLKPKGHPRQPQVEEIIEKAKELYRDGNYTNIYVATEEQKLYDKFENSFENGVVLCNNRTYYDDKYYNNESVSLIGEIHFERENDNYIKGIDYLTSLMILS